MTVTVRFSGPIRRPWPEASRSLEMSAGTTIAMLLSALGFARHELGFLQAAVNGVAAPVAAALADGDAVDVMLRVGGG
jgi:sulfur carrier protein ThiS